MDQTNSFKTALLGAECWVFDLDNTLYPASTDIFTQVDEKMTHFISEFLELDFEEAGKVRKDYYLEHGTTLAGLMDLHGMDPNDFLDFVHDIDLSSVAPNPGLDQSLSRLQGRKIIFTNGPTDHAVRIMDRLSIGHHFDAVFDIVGADYVPKPRPEAYQTLVERFRLNPRETVMVEDLVRNLAPAAAMGMTTVWVRPDGKGSPENALEADVDHVVDDLVTWLDELTAE
ncbi:MAG: pyrimidine 5'-nucleotidase [Rhodospirillales bacterium]